MLRSLYSVGGIIIVFVLMGIACDEQQPAESEETPEIDYEFTSGSGHFSFHGVFEDRDLKESWQVSLDSSVLGYGIWVKEYRSGFGTVVFTDLLGGFVRVDTLVSPSGATTLRDSVFGSIQIELVQYSGEFWVSISPLGQPTNNFAARVTGN